LYLDKPQPLAVGAFACPLLGVKSPL